MQPDLDYTLAALADPARRAIIELLGRRARRSSDLAAALSMSRPAMSRHLRVLRRAGVVEQEILESDARVRMVQLRKEPLSELRLWLEEVEAFWEDQLAAFKTQAERGRRKRRT